MDKCDEYRNKWYKKEKENPGDEKYNIYMNNTLDEINNRLFT